MLSSLLPNYLPYASTLSFNWNVPIEVIHIGAIALAILAIIFTVKICQFILSSILGFIIIGLIVSLFLLLGTFAIPFVLIILAIWGICVFVRRRRFMR